MVLRKLIAILTNGAQRDSRDGRAPKLIDLLNGVPVQPTRRTPTLLQQVQSAGQTLNPFRNDARRQHLTDLTATAEPYEPSEAEKQADGHLRFALTMLGVTTVGRLAFPPLLLLDLPAVLYIGWNSARFAYAGWQQKGRVTAETIDLALSLGIIAGGYYGFAFGAFTMTALCRKLLARTEDQSRKSLVNVFGQQPRTVWVLVEGVEVEVPFDQLQAGDTLIVGAGQVIAADGVVSSERLVRRRHED